MQANDQQLIILQSISKAPILIKGLKDENMEVGGPLLLGCSALLCLKIILISVHPLQT